MGDSTIVFEPVEVGEGDHRRVREMKGPEGHLWRPVPAFISETKTVDSTEGIVEAFVSITDIEDDVQDIILPGAYEATLQKRNPKGVWSHDWDTWTAKTLRAAELLPRDPGLPMQVKSLGGGALLVVAQFNLKTQAGHDAFANVEFFGDDCEWSIGYTVPKGSAAYDQKSGIRRIKALDLYEFSPVLFGAMSLTSTLSVKSRLAAIEQKTAASIARQERISVNLKAGKPPEGHSHDHTHPAEGDDEALTHSHDHDHSADSGYDHTSDADVAHEHDRGEGANDDNGDDSGQSQGAGGDRAGADSDTKRISVKEAGRAYLELKKDYSQETRDEMAKKDPPEALPDGSWPIGDGGDLDDAISSLGRTGGKGTAEYAKVKRWIIKRARQLDLVDKLPDDWDVEKGIALEAILQVKGGVDGLVDWYNAGADGQISWGDEGDFDQCVAVASQHMDADQAKGFCNLRHQDAVGGPPGSEGKRVRLRDGARWTVGEKLSAGYQAELKASPPARSFEERQSALYSAVRDWAPDTFDDFDPDTDWCYPEITYEDRVIVCVTVDGEDHYYSLPYTLEDPDGDGDVDGVTLGDPTEVDVQTVITPEGSQVAARQIPSKAATAAQAIPSSQASATGEQDNICGTCGAQLSHSHDDGTTHTHDHDHTSGKAPDQDPYADFQPAGRDPGGVVYPAPHAHAAPGDVAILDRAASDPPPPAKGKRTYWLEGKDVDPSDAGLNSGAGVHILTTDDIQQISGTVKCPSCAKVFGVSSDTVPAGSNPMLDHAVMGSDGNVACPYCSQTVALAPGSGTVKSAKLAAALKYAGVTQDASGSGVAAPSGGRLGGRTDATPDYAGTTASGGAMIDPGWPGPLGVDPDDPDHVVVGIRMLTPNVGVHIVDDSDQTHSLPIKRQDGDQVALEGQPVGTGALKGRKDVAGQAMTGSAHTPTVDDQGAHLHIEVRTLSPGVTLHIQDSLGEVHDLPVGYQTGDQLAETATQKALEILGVTVDGEGRYVKAGRVLSGVNATAIKDAVQKLVDVLERAGVDLSEVQGEGGEAKLLLTEDDRLFMEHLALKAELGIADTV